MSEYSELVASLREATSREDSFKCSKASAAIEALEAERLRFFSGWEDACEELNEMREERDKLAAELAQIRAQEPVGEVIGGLGRLYKLEDRTTLEGRRLYAHPVVQPGRELSDEEIRTWWARDNGLEDMDMCKIDDFTKTVRTIIAASKVAI